ncbi:unnamed protein product [Schistocephalus solidus]|uniref:Uncharacterized protein n=1 Tax=Schistocephalus solidus TaxID=70667 RepID=A0A183TC93_SCHSO|nr:unnamed protein product [Schistocephalus solidus]
MTPGSVGREGGECGSSTQGYYHLKIIHAHVTVPAPPGVEYTVDIVEIDGQIIGGGGDSSVVVVGGGGGGTVFSSPPISGLFDSVLTLGPDVGVEQRLE